MTREQELLQANRRLLTLCGLLRARADAADEQLRQAGLKPAMPLISLQKRVYELAVKHGVPEDALPPVPVDPDPAAEIDSLLSERTPQDAEVGALLPVCLSTIDRLPGQHAVGDGPVVGDAGSGESVADDEGGRDAEAVVPAQLEQTAATGQRGPWRFQRTRGVSPQEESPWESVERVQPREDQPGRDAAGGGR